METETEGIHMLGGPEKFERHMFLSGFLELQVYYQIDKKRMFFLPVPIVLYVIAAKLSASAC